VFQNQTVSEYLDLTNLTDKTTYYWTVDATDRINNHTDVPAEIWSFTVNLPPVIPPINHPPRITSTPPTILWVGIEYTYNLTSTDEDGDIPSYSITSGPPTMTLDSSTGRLRWTPKASDIGNHTISVHVTDGRGSFDNQTFTIEVLDIPVPPTIAPYCAITYPANGSRVNGTIQVRGTAVNGSRPLSAIKVRIDHGTWSVATGLENWTLTLNTVKLMRGSHRIEALAFAANLSSDTASVDFIVNNPEPPVSSGGNPWCLSATIIVIVGAGIAIVILLRKRVNKQL
jgi:hypothetical protein